MAVRSNSFYNNPEIGQAFAGIAQAFAPPGGGEVLAYTKAAAERAKEQRLAEYYNYAKDPNYNREQADRTGVALNLFNPAQSFYAVDRSNDTSRFNNAADNTRALDVAGMNNRNALTLEVMKPLGKDQFQQLPPKIADMFGVPQERRGIVEVGTGQTATLPGGEVIEGRTAAPTVDNVKAAILGRMAPNLQEAATFGNTPLQTVQGEGGPKLVTSLDAIGQAPVVDSGGKAQLKNYRTSDGRTGTARFDDGKGWVDTQSGAIIPAGSTTFDAALQGSRDETGLGQGNVNKVGMQILNSELAENALKDYRALITATPGALGALGNARRTLQDVMATGDELSRVMTGNDQRIRQLVKEGRFTQEVLDRFGNFDPNLPAVQAGRQRAVAALAAAQGTDGQVSNRDIDRVEQQIGGGGFFTGDKDALARVDATIQGLRGQRETLTRANPTAGSNFPGGGTDNRGRIDPRPAAAAAQQPNPAASGAPRAAPADLPVVSSPEAALALPPGTRFRTPDGREKVRP